MIIPVIPVPKPRMTRRDKWMERPCVAQYHRFKDELRPYIGSKQFAGSIKVVFYLPMPESWSNKKRERMEGQPHQVKPDRDNLEKALLDATDKNDSHIWHGDITKIWSKNPGIFISDESFV